MIILYKCTSFYSDWVTAMAVIGRGGRGRTVFGFSTT